ncbi:unnamed protein product, partial [Mesorhabditis belari]|uniref:Transposase n=1 Tax=Mesorhabditis belari TaxID=2138241 RepID=A0AAF3FQD6_9BILA
MTKPSAHRNSIIQLHKGGTRAIDISKRLKVSKKLVSTTIARFKELGTNFDRKGRGNKRSVINKAIIKKVRDRVRECIKVNAQNYLDILKNELLPWSKNHFGNRIWCFQQDGAPAHKAKLVQDWCANNFSDFISFNQWPPSSPDLNPMDFSVWSVLESQACAKSHKTVESLKKALQKAWEAIDPQYLLATVDAFPKRLQACIDAKGSHFEKN